MLVQAYEPKGCVMFCDRLRHQIGPDGGKEGGGVCLGVSNDHPQGAVQTHGEQTHNGFCVGTQVFPFYVDGEKLTGSDGYKFVNLRGGSKRNVIFAHTDSSSFISLYNLQKMRYNEQKQAV